MGYEDKEQKRARDREYYWRKNSPIGENHEQFLARRKEYYRKNYSPSGEKYEKHLAYSQKYNKEWRQRNKGINREKRSRKNQERRAWFQQYKATLSCIKCGENYPACLHFHHKDRNDKELLVGRCIYDYSFKKIMQEIEKCDVLCANCHRIEHWQERDLDADIFLCRELEEQLIETQGWLARKRLRNRIASLKNIIWFHEYKRSVWCQSCSISHPACLEFHHTKPGEKEIEIGNLTHWAVSIDRLKREISKCVVLCANCHAKLHWKEDSEYDEGDL